MTIRGNIEFEYDLAVQQGNSRRIQTLIKHKARPPTASMLFALIRKHPELLPLLKEAGADPDEEDGFHETALGHAVNFCSVEVVETVLKLGANPNKESLRLLPLVTAAHDRKIKHARTLLKYGADPNYPQWNGVIPLYSAVRDGEIAAAKLLLEAGADPTAKGPDGKTLVEFAKFLERKALVDLLKSCARDKGSTRGQR